MMENLQREQLWKKTTGGLYRAVLAYTLLAILFGIFACAAAVSMGASLLMGNLGPSFGIWAGLFIVIIIAIVAANIYFIVGLGRLKPQVNRADTVSVVLLFTAAILQIVIPVFSYFPKLKMIVSIITLAIWVLQLVCYACLKESQTFPELARRGMARIFWAQIVALVGALVVVAVLFRSFAGGGILLLLLLLGTLLVTLSGWKCIARSEAPALPQE